MAPPLRTHKGVKLQKPKKEVEIKQGTLNLTPYTNINNFSSASRLPEMRSRSTQPRRPQVVRNTMMNTYDEYETNQEAENQFGRRNGSL
jgi:hypothetical protein